MNLIQLKAFLQEDWARTKQRLFAKPDKQRVFALLVVGLAYVSFRGIEEITIAEKVEAEKYAQIEIMRQAGFDGIEKAAKDLRRVGVDETENYRNTVESLLKGGATQTEIKLRLKRAGFSEEWNWGNQTGTNKSYTVINHFTVFTNGDRP